MGADPGTPDLLGDPSDLREALSADSFADCCGAVYAHPVVRWLLGGELHPGGEGLTRRALELIGLRPGEELLDVGSGSGATARLAAREFGCRVTGVDPAEIAVRTATKTSEAEGLAERVGFVRADASALPFHAPSFDATISECSLCLFRGKRTALSELHRVLRPGGRLAISDVVAERHRLPGPLRGAMAQVACIGDALPRGGHERLLAEAGFEVDRSEDHDRAALTMAERVVDRLRGLRVMGFGTAAFPVSIDRALELAGLVTDEIAAGRIGYVLVSASRG
jgi:SAM-dependent methyltransferase